MYGLPENFDCSFFIGCTLELVCFSANQVIFQFSEKIALIIEWEFSYHINDSDTTSFKMIEPPVSESNLMQLLEHSISKATGDTDGTLTITFDNDDILKCFDTPYYEAYQIQHGERNIIV